MDLYKKLCELMLKKAELGALIEETEPEIIRMMTLGLKRYWDAMKENEVKTEWGEIPYPPHGGDELEIEFIASKEDLVVGSDFLPPGHLVAILHGMYRDSTQPIRIPLEAFVTDAHMEHWMDAKIKRRIREHEEMLQKKVEDQRRWELEQLAKLKEKYGDFDFGRGKYILKHGEVVETAAEGKCCGDPDRCPATDWEDGVRKEEIDDQD